VLKVWGRPNAYNVQKVLWALEEMGPCYEHINVGGLVGELDTREFRTMNPNGRIPVIQDDDLYVWESNTIIRYLASKYGASDLWVEDAAERTFVERWMDWELASLQPDFLSLFWGYYRTPEPQRDKEQIEYYRVRCKSNVGVLESALRTNPYVAGEGFTIADICVGTSFYRYLNMGLEARIPSNVGDWYQRLSERPSFQKVVMVSFDELRGRLEY